MKMSIQCVSIQVTVLIDDVPLNFVLSGRSPARELDRKLRGCGVSRSDRALVVQATADYYYGRYGNVYRDFLHVASRLTLSPSESEGCGVGRV